MKITDYLSGHPARSARTCRPETRVRHIGDAELPTRFGDFRIAGFEVFPDHPGEAVAIVRGDVRGKQAVLVRVHSECLTGDALGSTRCDCRDQLEAGLMRIGSEPAGVVVYLRQEGRGIGLLNKIRAYGLQDAGMDTVDANLALGLPDDARNYAIAARILDALGVQSIRLLTNNPDKVHQLEDFGIDVDERVSHVMTPTPENRFYLNTKARRQGHLLFPSSVAAK